MYTIGGFTFSGIEDGRTVLLKLKQLRREAQVIQCARVLNHLLGRDCKDFLEVRPGKRNRSRDVDLRQLNLF